MADQFQTGMEYLNAAPKPNLQPLPDIQAMANGMGGGSRTSLNVNMQAQAPPLQGAGLIPALIAEAEQIKGGKLGMAELEAVRLRARTEHVVPAMLRKGIQQFQVEAGANAFDSMYGRYAENYLKQGMPATPEGGTGGGGFVDGVKEFGSALGVGLVDLAGGLAGLADYGIRAAAATNEAIAKRKDNNEGVYDVLTKPIADIMVQYGASPTVIGKIGRGISNVAESGRQKLYTAETLDAVNQLGAKIEEGAGATVQHLLSNPQMISTIAGEMLGGVGMTKLATKLPKFAGMLERLGKMGEGGGRLAKLEAFAGKVGQGVAAATPTGLGYAGQQAMQFEKDIQGKDFASLIESPENQRIYAALEAAGFTGGELEKRTRDTIVARGVDDVLSTSLLANVLLPGLPGLGGAERVAAGVAKRGLGRGVSALRAASSEAAQEGLAGGIEQAGLNVGSGLPTGQGVGGNVAAGAVIGGLVGGVTGAALPNKLKRAAPTADETDTTATPPAPVAPAAATGTLTPVFSPTPAPDFGKVVTGVVENLQTDRALKKAAKDVKDVNELLVFSENAASELSNDSGTAWESLDQQQQLDLTEAVAEALNNNRQKTKFEDLGTAVVTWKQGRLDAAARLAATANAVAPAATPAPAAATPAPGETAPVAPATAVPATPPVDTTPAEAQAALAALQPPPAAAQTQPTEDQRLFEAVVKHNKLSDVGNEDLRNSPIFPILVQAFKDGKIKTVNELKTQLEVAEETVRKAPSTKDWSATGSARTQTIAELKAAKGALQTSVKAAKSKASDAFSTLISMGVKASEVNAMTLTDAKATYDRLSAEGKRPGATVVKTATAQAGAKKPLIKAKTKPKKKTPLKKETSRPKTQAPAQSDAGAAAATQQEPQPAQSQPNPNEPEDVEVRVSSILKDSAVSKDIQADIVLAVVNDSMRDLSAHVKTLREADDITKEQAAKLRSLVIRPKAQPGLTEVAIDSEEAIGDRSELIAQLDRIAVAPTKNIQIAPKLTKWLTGILSGKYNEADFAALANEMNGLRKQLSDKRTNQLLKTAMSDRVRGADWFEERLARALRNNELPKNTIEFMRWFIRKNPNVVADLGLSIKQLNTNRDDADMVTRANYVISQRILNLATDAKVAEHSGVHEILHHTERMMPENIREGIRAEYVKALLNRWTVAKDPLVKQYLEDALRMHVTKDYSKNATSSLGRLLAKIKAETSEGFASPDLYKYFNPSEYWAVTGPTILADRMMAESNGWVAQAKQWIKEFVEKLKSLVDAQNQSAVIRGLDSILKGDGKFLSRSMLSNETKSLSDATTLSSMALLDKKNWKNTISAGKTNARTFWEFFAQKSLAFEQELARLVNVGGKITPDTDPVEALVRYNGIRNDRISLDESEVGGAVYDWFTKNWQEYGDTRVDAISKINTFLHNTHVLERYHIHWLLNVKLEAGKAYNREKLIIALRDGKKEPDAVRRELETLVSQHRSVSEADYVAKRFPNYDSMVADLVKLKGQGIDGKTMTEFNGILKNVRDRTMARNIESGFVSEDDPWVNFYNFKWYVPLKGTNDAEIENVIQDLDQEGRMGRASLARINKQLQQMTGRKTIAESPLEQLMVDMSLAGRRTAEQDFVGAMYKLITSNRKHYPDAVIDVFEGTPKDGYKHVSGKKKKVKGKKQLKEYYRALPAPGDGFIFHDGDTHYVVKLPESSLLLRGILSMSSDIEPDFFSKVVGKGTNLLSKLYTTANPIWQTFVALPRDLTYMPIMMAMRESSNPFTGSLFMAKYVKSLMGNAFQLDNLPHAIKILSGNRVEIEEYAKKNPDSYVGWLRRYERAGGSTNFVAGFNTESIGNKFTSKYNNAEGIYEVSKVWKGWEKLTTNYASLLENIGRTAAFRTLVENGKTEAQAAAQVKDYLNYDQTGRVSRYVNSYLPFFKVGMTGADAIRKTFVKKDGTFDAAKLAAWGSFFAVIGFAKYILDDELMGEDEEGERRIKKINLDTLTQKSLMPFGENTYGFNIGLGLPQILLAPGVVAAAVMKGHRAPEEGGRAMYEMIARNAPVRPAGLPDDWGITDLAYAWTIGGLIPGVVRPVTDAALNRDAFGRPVHTKFPREGMFKSDDSKSSTPQVWNDIATWMREEVGVDMYAEDIRYMVRNYGGQPAAVAMRLTIDADAKEQEGAESMRSVGRATGLEVVDEDFYLRNQAYDTIAKLSEPKKRLSSIEKAADRQGRDKDAAGRAWLAATPGAASQIAAGKALDKAITAYNKEVKAIRADRLRGQTWKETARKKADSKLRMALEDAKKKVPE